MKGNNENDGGGGSKIKVAIRVRPLQDHEINAGHDTSRYRIEKNAIL